MPKLSFIDSLLGRGKRSIPSDVLKAGSILSLSEGDEVFLTYTSAVDKMKFFSAFIREGLESGDAVWYTYPHEESETVRAELRKYGINIEKHESNGSLNLSSLTEDFMSNGKLDCKKAVTDGINWWNEAKRKGYKHARGLEDVGDFSFVNGQWQKYITDYYLDPRWDDPNTSEWVLPDVSREQQLGVVMSPFLMEITAVNVEHMAQNEVNELLKALSGATVVPSHAFIDLFEYIDTFSRSIGLDHKRLVGRKILFEFDPVSNYEKVISSLSKESLANVEPIFVFTPSTSPIHQYLANQPTIKFFLTSLSTSTPKSISENKVLLPAKNTPLILDTLNKVLETNVDANVCFVFDILSELLTTTTPERTFTFLRHALDLLSSEKVTSLFLFNTGAHETEVVSRLRNLFSNQLTYDKNGLEIVKTS
jgi:hypothetical protein